MSKEKSMEVTLPHNLLDIIGYHQQELATDHLDMAAYLQDSKTFNQMPKDARVDLMLSMRDMLRIWILLRDLILEQELKAQA